ncbi:MAG: hydroxymethylglutaryl-CoA lyase [Pseudomonadota bacterium]
MPDPKKVFIREVAPRDGFQSWPDFVPTEKKIEVITAIMAAGVAEMETTSFVSPKAIPQMRDAAEVMRAVPRSGCRHEALVPNLQGARMALEAGAQGLVVVISAGEAHNLANIRRTIAQSLEDLRAIFDLAAGGKIPVIGALAVSFGCPFQGDISEDEVFRLADAFAEGGAASVILADTTGMATPPRVETLVRRFMERFPGLPYSLHFHNNRGTAMTNLYAGLRAGAETFDAALGGVGGCPNVPQAAGNLPTEDVVYLLEELGYDSGVDLLKIIEAARLLEKILGRTLPGQVMKSGPRNPGAVARICGTNHTARD